VLRNSVVALLQQRPDSAPSPDAVKDRRVDNQPRMRILVLVHDPILRRLCEVTMSGWPMAPEIVATDNAVAGLVMMGRNCPDLLIIDLHIPGIDALQMLRSIRQTAELAQPTIVVIAGPHDARGNERGGIPTGIEVLPIPIPFHRLQSIASGIVTHPGFNRLARS
jgi:CheY-like chemotaxis protein